MSALLMVLGFSAMPVAVGFLLGQTEMGVFGSLIMFIYLAVESEINTIIGIAVFIIVIIAMYLGLQLADNIGVGSNG